jgi:hypothetical protein
VPARAAGVFEAKFGADAAKLSAEVDLSMMNGDVQGSESGRGPQPYLKALGAPPARIALISFYVRDMGNKKENSYTLYGGNYRYRTTNTRTIQVEIGALGMLATELHDASIGALKEAFAGVGSKLLTPDEFLDTEARRKAYQDFTFELGFFEKAARKLLARDTPGWRFVGAPEGYRAIELTTVGNAKGNDFRLATTGIGVGELAQKAGHDLAEALGVDAVAIFYNYVQGQKDSISLRGSYLYLFGPNPVPNTGQSLYWRGHQYSGVYLKMNVPFVKTDKDGHLVSADYEGYALVAKALGLRMAEHVRDETGWDGKPREVKPGGSD